MKPIIKRNRRAGAAIVEASLTLGLYCAIVFSIFDFGYVLYMHQTVANRVAAAARYGALNPTDTTGIRNYVLYSRTTGSGAGLFGITAADVTATRLDSGTTADRVVVTVTGFRFLMIAPAYRGTSKPITVTLPVEAN